jgi:hypothetical protein
MATEAIIIKKKNNSISSIVSLQFINMHTQTNLIELKVNVMMSYSSLEDQNGKLSK